MIDILSQQVQVGDVLVVHAGEEFPCDMVLLSTNDPESGECYITTVRPTSPTSPTSPVQVLPSQTSIYTARHCIALHHIPCVVCDDGVQQ